MKNIFFILLILLGALYSNSIALTFNFSSYTIIEGQVKNENGNPIENVMVSYLDFQHFYKVFTDSSGYYKLDLELDDGTLFEHIRSKDQIDICFQYMTSFSILKGPDKEINKLIGENLYDRNVRLLLFKSGMDSVVIDTVVVCRMKERDLKVNKIDIEFINLNTTTNNLNSLASRNFLENKIYYNDIDYWFRYKKTRYYTHSDGFQLINDIDRNYIHMDLWQYGEKIKIISKTSLYCTIAGLGVGLVGALITKSNDRYYPISIGLLSLMSGWYLESKSWRMKKNFILRYNTELYNKITYY